MDAARHILIVDDDEKILKTLRAYLEHDGFSVGIAIDGVMALEQARERAPDLVVLDLMLPQLDGIEVCRQLREHGSVPIIMLTARTTEPDKLRGLKAGADDYITKPFSPRELVARIHAVLRRTSKGATRTGTDTFGELQIDRGGRRVQIHGLAIALTPTEYRLLETLTSNPGIVMSRSHLIERSLGWDYDGMDRTIDVHVRNIRRKLEEAGGDPKRIRTVPGSGYSFESHVDG
jgi:two-component system alkaline phosphatase synthesis response regulator PhoP